MSESGWMDGFWGGGGVFKALLQGSGAERIESEAFFCVHNRQLSRHCQHGAFARRVRQLRRRAAHQRDHAGGVDDAADFLAVPPHAEHGVLAAEPDALDVDIVGQIPDLFRGVYGVGVVGVHDAGVVEHDVDAAPGVEVFDHGFDVGFFGHVAFDRFESGRVGHDGVDF